MNISIKKTFFSSGLIFIILSLFSPVSHSLEPGEVLVIFNTRNRQSVKLADYYMKERNIPPENRVKVFIDDSEDCTYEDYLYKIARPVKKVIREKGLKSGIRCLLIMYGIPLKIDHIKNPGKGEKTANASVDSELALIFEEGYDLSGWQPNPFYVGYGQKYEDKRDHVFLVSRLDGPDPGTVKRIIDDSITAEKTGLTGNAFFDARWKRDISEKGEKSGYTVYDKSIHTAAEQLEKSGLMPVKLDDNEALFKEGECPDAALYCGWYSLGKYIDAFFWKKGAVGYHIASSECTTLKKAGSQVWCKRMLEQGIAATVGPVNEPYVQAFPMPELFFRFLTDGYWSLAESYALSQPFWSWQMVLIGDPLYRPFKNRSR